MTDQRPKSFKIALQYMKKIYLGIDISKEKLNLCYRQGLKIVLEEECSNDMKSIIKAFKASFKSLEVLAEDVLVCAEYTGRYIYPLTVACQDMDVYLWLDDPTRIRNSFGIVRGKSDSVDAARIAEYAFRFSDKATRYTVADKSLSSIKNLLSDRDFLLTDRKRYQAQIHDQRKYTDPNDFKRKNGRWNKVIRIIDEQIDAIDKEIDSLISADPKLSRQKELLLSIDGVGERIAVNMIAVTAGFSRFKDARHFCSFAGLAPYRYESGTSVRSRTRISKRSNQTIKALLHLSAVNIATRMKDGEMKEYYIRKTSEGKHVMCVLNVIRAKLVHRMFSVIQRDSPYSRIYTNVC